MRFFLIAIILMFCSVSISAQNSYEVSKESINQKLGLLSTYYQTLLDYNEEDGDFYFDPDSLSVVIAKDFITLFEMGGWNNFRPEDFPEIELIDTATFQVLSFSYYCGGSAGLIPTSIIIKQTSDSYEFVNMAGSECGFYDFYRLKDETYLCIAYAPGSGTCRNNGLYVIDFSVKGGKLMPIFGDKSYLYICNSDIYFDDDEKLLTIDIWHSYCDCKSYSSENRYDFFSVKCTSEWNEDQSVILTTIFDGDKFIKP